MLGGVSVDIYDVRSSCCMDISSDLHHLFFGYQPAVQIDVNAAARSILR